MAAVEVAAAGNLVGVAAAVAEDGVVVVEEAVGTEVGVEVAGTMGEEKLLKLSQSAAAEAVAAGNPEGADGPAVVGEVDGQVAGNWEVAAAAGLAEVEVVAGRVEVVAADGSQVEDGNPEADGPGAVEVVVDGGKGKKKILFV